VWRIVYAFFYLISLLPFGVLYLFSDFLYLLIYKLGSYRIEVTRANLERSFPNKTEAWRRQVEKTYYKNLCDSVVETLKLISLSEKKLNERMSGNWPDIEKGMQGEQRCMAYLAHQFNWEWGTVVANWNLSKRFTGVYQPLSSALFEKVTARIRTRSGTDIVPVSDLPKNLGRLQKEEIVWGFIADQNPSDARRASWNSFFEQMTAFAKGAEFVARRYNNKVYFGEIVKIKRGFYEIKLKLAFDAARNTSEGEITEAYVRFLEDSIKRQPENWVWSHRRWKHVYPQEV